MPVETENLAEQLLAEAVHDGHHDDQRSDAEHDAQKRKAGDDRDEAFLATRTQIASRQQPLEWRERWGPNWLAHGFIHSSIFTRFGLIVAVVADIATAAVDNSSRGQLCHDIRRAEILARAVAAPLDLELAFGKALRADQNLPGNTDQVGGGELGAGALVGVVVQYFDAPGGELAIKLFARSIGVGRALLQIEDRRPERRHRFRPFDAGVVVAGLDDRADQPRYSDAVGTAMDRDLRAIGARDQGLHRIGIFGAEVEDLADLDAARVYFPVGRYFVVETTGVVDVFGRGIDRDRKSTRLNSSHSHISYSVSG